MITAFSLFTNFTLVMMLIDGEKILEVEKSFSFNVAKKEEQILDKWRRKYVVMRVIGRRIK